ncbi:hypothetical protein NLI96_g9171 [Meripilus lineatus]|uniref:4-hydroxybenzoate polyprenyltransferase, mitochondrial n=1 Tax=Meripilus lineatus TaxID=2056292 RepID=A0AAD5YBA9_9APHY|nr:hypothetical protein NLI96_g9171 [Physisporinus lineatus]
MGVPETVQAPKLAFPLAYVPPATRPYLELIRFEKPTGTWLTFWPFAWGLTMAAYRTNLPLNTYLTDLLRYFFIAFIIRSSACTVNDMFDRKIDAGVERTKNRPLASGRISVFAAFIYLMFQYALGAWVCKGMHEIAYAAAMTQMLPLLSIYPLFKRYTYWPQAYLGIGMSFGLVAAWVDTTHTIDYELLGVMLASGWCWTMQYDTIYACQDRKDDVKMGVHSTAVLFGDYVMPFIKLNALSFLALLAYAGTLNNQGTPYYVVTIGGTALWLIRQFAVLDLEVSESCWNAFKKNGQLGWVVTAGLALDYLFKLHSAI